MKNPGFISSPQRKTSQSIRKAPKGVNLIGVLFSKQKGNHIRLIPRYQNKKPDWPIRKHIQAAISPLFASAEAQLDKELAQQTLEDVINNLYKDAKQKRN